MRRRSKNNSHFQETRQRIPTQALDRSQPLIYQNANQRFPYNRTPNNRSHYYPPQFAMQPMPDSLERLEMYLDRQWRRNKEREEDLVRSYMKKGRRRVVTQIDSEEEEHNIMTEKISSVLGSINELKGEIIDLKKDKEEQNHKNLEDKFDKLLNELVKRRQQEQEMFRQQRNAQPMQNPIFYPYPPPYEPRQRGPYDERRYRDTRRRHTSKDRFKPTSRINRAKLQLKKYIRAVVFVSFLKAEAKKLAQKRKQNMRKFYLQKFDKQMVNLKNWLLEGQAFALPIILEKQNLHLQFWKESRSTVSLEKQSLLLKLVQLGLQKTKKECIPSKLNIFMELLHNLCGRGSFPMSRFWSAVEMQNICISETYGCVRADDSLQKLMLCFVVFMKVLIFNMLLQPHKFDPVNFPKNKQTLTKLMYLIASVYYKLSKAILNEYWQVTRPNYFKLGNWLKVNEKFIVQCCEPLTFGCDYPQEGELISGLLDQQLQSLQMRSEWTNLLDKMRQIIEFLHKQMLTRRKQVVRNDKYKLYN